MMFQNMLHLTPSLSEFSFQYYVVNTMQGTSSGHGAGCSEMNVDAEVEMEMQMEVDADEVEPATDEFAPFISRHGEVRLPPPADGNAQYDPKEAVTLVLKAQEMSFTKKQMGALKRAIDKKIPRSISSLERKVTSCRENPGLLGSLPVEWGNDMVVIQRTSSFNVTYLLAVVFHRTTRLLASV